MYCYKIASPGTQRQDKYIYGGCGKGGKLKIQLALDKDFQFKAFSELLIIQMAALQETKHAILFVA